MTLKASSESTNGHRKGKTMTKVKVMQINSVRKVNSKKNPGQTFDVILFTDQNGGEMDTLSKVEAGKEYEGEITSDQWGVHFKMPYKSGGASSAKVEELLTEILEVNKQILAKMGQTSKREEVLDDEEPPVESYEIGE